MLIGTDGSVLEDGGTYAFVIYTNLEDEEPTVAAKSGGWMTPLAEFLELDSHRPEAAALYAAMHFLQGFLRRNPQTFIGPLPEHTALRFVLDNKSVTQDLEWNLDVTSSVFEYLRADYDILQGIQRLKDTLPIKSTVRWVKGHQDRHKEWDQLSIEAKVNVLADRECDAVYQRQSQQSGIFPTRINGTKAVLLHKGLPVTKKLESYVRIAATAPRHRAHLIKKSKDHDSHIEDIWDDDVFDDIDWQAHGRAFKALRTSRKIQISKYIHKWTPTLKQRSYDNSIDSRCQSCGRLWEDLNHVLRCTSDERTETREEGLQAFQQHLSSYDTPAPMAELLLSNVQRWFRGQRPLPPTLPPDYTDPDSKELHNLLVCAYERQTRIGWTHFLRGRLTKAWQPVLKYYYRMKGGIDTTPALWSHKTIDFLWELFINIWYCRNGELHGHNYKESRAKALAMNRTTAREVYEATEGNVTEHEARLLHRNPVDDILTWTKAHLDAYLATAEVILEQNVDPG